MCTNQRFVMDVLTVLHVYCLIMRGSRKFCQRGSKFESFFFYIYIYFLVDEGIEDPNTTINGP